MLITRKNLKGGRKLTTFPLVEENGLLGYQIGYCCNCNERLLMRTIDTQEILSALFRGQKTYKNLLKKLTPKISFKRKFINWLLSKQGDLQVVDNF